MINPGAKAWQHQVSLSIPAFVGIKKLRYLYRYLPKPTNEQPSPPVSIIGRYRYTQEIAPYGSRHDLTVRHSNARANHQEIFGGLCGSRGHVVRSSQDIASFLGTLKSFCVLGLPISQKVIVLSRLQFSLFTEVLSTFLFFSFFFTTNSSLVPAARRRHSSRRFYRDMSLGATVPGSESAHNLTFSPASPDHARPRTGSNYSAETTLGGNHNMSPNNGEFEARPPYLHVRIASQLLIGRYAPLCTKSKADAFFYDPSVHAGWWPRWDMW